jgi:hypothetical protein
VTERDCVAPASPTGRHAWGLPEPSPEELDRRERRRPLQRLLDADQGIPIKRRIDPEVAELLGLDGGGRCA